MPDSITKTKTVPILGAGPVGLAAAAHVLERCMEPVVLEAGPTVGHAVRQWSHVQVFSPWEYNIDKALAWCDVANVLRIQLERQNQPLFSSLREYNLAYGITKARLQKLNKDILIMHPGPINRGVEMDSDVADGQQSIILDQVENGVAVRMACLYLLTGRTNP